MLTAVASAVVAFFVTVLAIVALRPVALAVDLVDRPGGRKTHTGNVPIVGGLAMFLGIVVGIGLLPLPVLSTTPFLAACGLLVTVGLFDDRFELSPWLRLPVQMSAATVLVYSGTVVTTLGAPFGQAAEIYLEGAGSIAFTMLIVIASINAFNMLDGMDGLAGATAVVAIGAIAAMAGVYGAWSVAAAALVFAGAIAAFLIFNLPTQLNRRIRCFMGDAGSTLLGFGVAWLCLRITQEPLRAVAPVTVLWVVALPLYELLWTTIRRILRGASPLRPDSDHFHHLLLRAGFGVRGAFTVYIGLAVLLALAGTAIELLDMPDWFSALMLLAGGVAVVQLMHHAEILWKILPDVLRRLPLLEGGLAQQAVQEERRAGR